MNVLLIKALAIGAGVAGSSTGLYYAYPHISEFISPSEEDSPSQTNQSTSITQQGTSSTEGSASSGQTSNNPSGTTTTTTSTVTSATNG